MMPKAKLAPGPKQITISKFFALKQGLNKNPVNGVEVVTDLEDQETDAGGANTCTIKSKVRASVAGQKRKQTKSSTSPKCKRQFTDTQSTSTDVSQCKKIQSTTTFQALKNCQATDIYKSASTRLKLFAFDDDETAKQTTEQRMLWQPRNLPDLNSDNAIEKEMMHDALEESDNNSDDDCGPGCDSKKISSCIKGRKSDYSSATFLEKFSAAASSSPTWAAVNKKTKTKYTPLELQYIEIKEQNPDAILLVECGYKYRFFGSDAEVAANTLKIICHPDHNFMTASIPVHRLFVHIRRLVAAGYKVGVVKQTETAALKAAGDNRSAPFSRQLTALYTKSTLIGEDVNSLSSANDAEEDMKPAINLQPHSYLMCIYDFHSDTDTKQQEIGIVAVDPATSDILYDCFFDRDGRQELETRITHLQPVEVLMSSIVSLDTERLVQGIVATSSTEDDRMRIERMEEDKFCYTQAFKTVTEFYSHSNERGLQEVLALPKPVICCLAALIVYLKDFNLHTVLSLTSNMHQFSVRAKFLHLSSASLRNLEIFQNSTNGTEYGSLFWLLNNTSTRFGARLLQSWLAQPLRDIGEIVERQDAVQELCREAYPGLKKLRETLAKCPDLEKGLCSIFHKKSSPAEFVSVTKALTKICHEAHLLQGTELPMLQSALLKKILVDLPDLLEDMQYFSDAISEKAARENDKPNLFLNDSRYPEIAEVKGQIKAVMQEMKDYLKEIRAVLRQPSLNYVTVLQTEFLVEVKNIHLQTVPSDWTKISSTKAVSRFHPTFVVSKYKRLSQLREQLMIKVTEAWQKFLKEFSEGFLRYKKAVQLLASLDVLMSLSKIALQDGYCRPQLMEDEMMIDVEAGRHPVITAMLGEREQYVPNNTHLNADGQRVMIVTGPNMGGKSSYIRQVALIAIMAQIGSFVPANSARLGILDAIYTRMGAEDEIFKGRSTFMFELQEASDILSSCTEHSLVIMDELGRGTSTHDGVAIALATLHHFITQTKCLTLFVTHYPLLAEFQKQFPQTVGNYHMAFLLYNGHGKNESSTKIEANDAESQADSTEEVFTFLYQLTEGAAKKSYGLNVARLAQIPDDILHVGTTMSHQLEERILQRRIEREGFVSLYHASEDKVKEVLNSLPAQKIL